MHAALWSLLGDRYCHLNRFNEYEVAVSFVENLAIKTSFKLPPYLRSLEIPTKGLP